MKNFILFILTFLSYVIPAQEKLYIIPIKGTIEPALTIFIRNGIKEAQKENAQILFEIDTFGGRVDSALQITTLIGSIKDKETIAYIPSDPEGLGVSWSAGALISFACNKIYMAEGTSIGAAAPVYLSPEGTQSAEEKTVSAVRVQMQSLAEKNEYPPDVALAMVDKDVELYQVFINDKPHLLPIEKIDVNADKTIFLAKGKLLTLTSKQMEYYNISEKTVDGLTTILQELNIKPENVVRIEQNIPDQLIAFITSSTVLALLMTLGLVALYLELTSPGFGILGSIGIIAFSVVFLGGELMGTLSSLELLLFLLGIALLVIEIFIVPGFGITGLTGLICIGLALVLSMQDFLIPKWDWQWTLFNRNILVVFIGFIASLGIITGLILLFPKLSLFNRLILNHSSPAIPKNNENQINSDYYGITLTKLRPVGKIKTDSEVLEVISEGQFIEKGVSVKIIFNSGNRIVVKEALNETNL